MSPLNGTTFPAALPFRRSISTNQKYATSTIKNTSIGLPVFTAKRRVLVVEDVEDVRNMMQEYLAGLGHEVSMAVDGPQGVAKILELLPDVSFVDVGLPGFQLMVDRLEYNSRTHHSTMDTFDRVQRDDMVQQATVIAVFAYDAAMRDEKLPRKALPPPRRRPAPSAGEGR